MKTIRIVPLSLLVALLYGLVACGSPETASIIAEPTAIPPTASPTLPPVPPTQTPAASSKPPPQQLPTSQPISTPKPIVASATLSGFTPTPPFVPATGGDISYNGIRFQYDPAFRDVVLIDKEETHGVYTIYYFQNGNIDNDSGYLYLKPYVLIRPISEEEPAVKSEVAIAIDEASPNFYRLVDHPHIEFETKGVQLSFQNGNGVRYLQYDFGEGKFFASNDGLKYIYSGVTEDGNFQIQARFDIAASILMTNPFPDENENGDVFAVPDFKASKDEIYALRWSLGEPERVEGYLKEVEMYNREAMVLLNELPADRFSPNLDLLDELIESILVQDISD
ncbi:MAG: hypothetical protein AAGD96_13680 [Chloroflexota bacterium]